MDSQNAGKRCIFANIYGRIDKRRAFLLIHIVTDAFVFIVCICIKNDLVIL